MKKIAVILFVIFAAVRLSFGQTNIGFEQTLPGVYTASNAVSGWTLESTSSLNASLACNGTTTWSPGSSEFSVVATPVPATPFTFNPFSINYVPILNSPLGGNNVVRLQDASGSGLATRLRSTFPVTTANSMFYFAYAGSWDGSTHGCCDQPSFNVRVYSCSGLVNTCLSLSVTPVGSLCNSGSVSFSITSAVSWNNWHAHNVDLSPYIGSCVTIEVTNSDCTDGFHHGSVYFDAKTDVPFKVNYCPGSPVATIAAPFSYGGYQWYAPGNPPVGIPTNFGGNSQLVTITNPLPGSVYTVQMQSIGGCTAASQATLQVSSVSITGIGSTSTTCGTSIGSATVAANGSGSGYNYAWYSPGGSNPVGTGTVISNLAAGVYTVGVSAMNSVGCGSAVATVTVGINTLSSNIHYYCGNAAYLSAPSNVTNIQWYNGLTAIPSGLGGTAQNYTVTSPTNNQYLWLSYNANLLCRDSVKIILTTGGPVNFTLSSSSTTLCQGSTVTASISLPGPSALYTLAWSPSTFLYSGSPNQQTMAISPYSTAGTTNNIVYTVVVTPTGATLCPATKTLGLMYVSPNTPTIAVIPALCANSTPFSINVNPPGGTFFGGIPVVNGGIIVPSYGSPGSYQFSYAALVGVCTATAVGSFLTKALPPVSISGNTVICAGNTTTLSVTGADSYSWSTTTTAATLAVSPVVTSIFTVAGTSTVTSCVNTKTVQIKVNPLPVLSLAGLTTLCSGRSSALTASGAGSYTWSTNATGSVIAISPTATTTYSIAGTNTLTNCSNTTSVQITVNPIPALSVTGNTTICEGETTTIVVSGANGGYQWSNGSTTNSIEVSPAGTTAYSILGTNLFQCVNSTTVTILVSECTQLAEISASEQLIQIYPNPTSDHFFIDLKSSAHLILYDQSGAELLKECIDAGKHMISLGEYPAGIYILKTENRFSKATRIIKIVRIPN